MKRTNAVMVRLDDAQARELDALASAVGIPASTLAHAAVLGMLRGYRRHGRMTLPLEMIPALDDAPLDNPTLTNRLPAAVQQDAAKAGIMELAVEPRGDPVNGMRRLRRLAAKGAKGRIRGRSPSWRP